MYKSRYEIVEFETSRGDRIINSFLERKSRKIKAKAYRLIDMLQYEINLGMPYSRKIDKDLFELRLTGKPAIRVIYTHKDKQIFLLHIFEKKQWKIPKKELRIALKRLELI